MRKLLLSALLFVANAAFAATLVPVQLINPIGSTSGQAIVSTGASSAPAWSSIVDSVVAGSGITLSGATGNVTISVAANAIALSQLAQISANVVLGNPSGSTANVGQIGVPSCSTSASALQWTSGTGFTCGTVATSGANSNITSLSGLSTALSVAQGGTGATSSTGSGSVVLATSPTITTPGITGVTNGSGAAAGNVGELFTPTNLTGVSLTSNTGANVSSAPLTAGDWLVQCTVNFAPASTTVVAQAIAAVSTSSGSIGSAGNYAQYENYSSSSSGGNGLALVSPTIPITITSPTTAYCVADSGFSTSTMTASGYMRAWRLH